MRVNPAVPYTAGAVIAPRRFLKFSGVNTVIQATSATDAIIGVSDSLGAPIVGQKVDVYTSGPQVEVEAGGPINPGDEVTSDAVGRAVVSAPGVGVTHRTGGVSMDASVLGDLALVNLTPGSKTRAA